MASPLIEYTNLLHKVGSPDDPRARAFKEEHRGDAEFQRRVRVVEMTFRAQGDAGEQKQHRMAPSGG